MNRVAVSGMGCISAVGANIDQTLQSFAREKRNAGPVRLFPSSIKCPVFEASLKHFTVPDEKMRSVGFALVALNEALQDAGLTSDLDKYRVGVCMGTTVGSQIYDIDFLGKFLKTGSGPMKAVNRFLKGNIAEAIALKLDVKGPNCTIVNACTSGSDAIGIGLEWLRNDICDIVIAGGADELSLIALSGFRSLGLMSDALCSPFDRDRSGLNLGEGAGILILESEKISRMRKRKTQLYLAGYGSAADGYHLTAPRPDGAGLKNALQRSLKESGITPADVSFINAHGTATRDNDPIEGSVLRQVFGSRTPVISTKGFTGHALGAAGGLEAVFTAVGLREGWIPPSVGFKHKDRKIPLIPSTERRKIEGRYAVSTSLGFGGNNSALVFERA